MLAESTYEARLKWLNGKEKARLDTLLTWLDNILKSDSADHAAFNDWYASSRHMQGFVDNFLELRHHKTLDFSSIAQQIERIIFVFTCFQRDRNLSLPSTSYRLPGDLKDPSIPPELRARDRQAPTWYRTGTPISTHSKQHSFYHLSLTDRDPARKEEILKAAIAESKQAAEKANQAIREREAAARREAAEKEKAAVARKTAASHSEIPQTAQPSTASILRSPSQTDLSAYLRQTSQQASQQPAPATPITIFTPPSVHDLLKQEATAESKTFRSDTPIQPLPELSLPPAQTRSVPPQYNSRARTDLTSRLAAIEAQTATTTTTAESTPVQTHHDKAREALSEMAQRSLSAFTEHLRAPSPTMIHSVPEKKQPAATATPTPFAEKRRPFSLSLPTLSPISAVSSTTKSASASPKDRSSTTVPAVGTYTLQRSVTPTQKYHSDPVGTADPVTTYHNPIYGQPKKPETPARPASTSPRRTSISTKPASAADDAVSGCCLLSSRRESVPSRTSSSIYASPSRSTPSSPTKPTYLAQAYEELRRAQRERDAADRAQQHRSPTPTSRH